MTWNWSKSDLFLSWIQLCCLKIQLLVFCLVVDVIVLALCNLSQTRCVNKKKILRITAMNPQFCSQTKMKTYQPWVFWLHLQHNDDYNNNNKSTWKIKVTVGHLQWIKTRSFLEDIKSRNVKAIMLNMNYSVLPELWCCKYFRVYGIMLSLKHIMK